MKKLIIFLLFINVYSQEITPIDAESFEFIENVNFKLYLENKEIYSNTCKNGSKTLLPNDLKYDSIEFENQYYNALKINKKDILKHIYLTKKTIELNEVILVNNSKIFGEKKDFVNDKSKAFSRDLNFGTRFENKSKHRLKLNKIVINVDKVKQKTLYKIKFFDCNTSKMTHGGRQSLDVKKLLLETDTLILEINQKNEISINIEDKNFEINEDDFFVTLELINYIDENGKIFISKKKNETRLKFTQSDVINYFSNSIDSKNKKTSELFYNINSWINYDFANVFYQKPSKKTIITPSLLVYTTILH
jgi:hypothetical protein